MPKLLERIDPRDEAGKPRMVLRLAWSRERPRRGEPPCGRSVGDVYLSLREGGEVAQLDFDTFEVPATGEILTRHEKAETAAATTIANRHSQAAAASSAVS